MKNFFLTGLLGLTALTVVNSPVNAGTFGLCIWRGKFCGKCCDGCSVCIRPYNAFTPVVSGNIMADGCFPIASHGCGPQCARTCGMPITGMTCQAPGMEAAPMAAMPNPMQQQMAAMQYMMQQQMAARQAMQPMGVQPVGYYPAYNYGYGYGYYPTAQRSYQPQQGMQVTGNR